MSDGGPARGARDAFRKQRRSRRRRRSIGGTMIVAGLVIAGIGVALFLGDRNPSPPIGVDSKVEVRTTTTTVPPPSSTTPAVTTSAPPTTVAPG